MNAIKDLARAVQERPSVDQLCGTVLASGYIIFHFANIARPHLDQATTLIIYQTLAGIGAALLGLVFAAIAIIRALDPGRRLNILQARYGRTITGAMKAVIRGLGIATLGALLAMLLDQPGGAPVVGRAIALFSVGLATARIIRLAWIFSLILDINDSDNRLAAAEKVDPVPVHRRAAGQ